ncbi:MULTISPECIES: tetratricopeptide repeat protein [Flammeovirga]|nr:MULTISPECIES: tetratricopeptide repeat protein [Flammeovirga]ANQ47554.1 tetratricopeptide repeat protein [Flammeovirga sp. MY04]MBB3698593.1 tetratricopeptide (TPR) repeat protein [Flammeovirga yaeyamensis]NMF34058.1 tetratricopeptide repeat protein [Flammeovirga yaeyamensis]
MKLSKFHIILSLFCSMAFFNTVNAQNANDFLEKADFLLANNRYQEGLDMLDKAIAASPKDGNIYFKKANTYLAVTKFNEAIKTLEDCVVADPNYFRAYEMLGDLYSQRKQPIKAVKYYDLAYQKDDGVDQKYLYKLKILDILDQANRHRFSKKHIDDVRKLNLVESFDLDYYEAMYWNEMGHPEKAEELMAKIIGDIEPLSGNERYYYQYIWALFEGGKYAEAQEWMEKINTSEAESMFMIFKEDYYFNLAQTYFTVMDYEKSQQMIDVTLGINSSYIEAFDLQKQLAAIRTDKTKVIAAQDRALMAEKDVKKRSAKLLDLANLNYQSMDFATAYIHLEEFQKALPQNERNLNVIFIKTMCEKSLGELGVATEKLKKVIHNPTIKPPTKAKYNFAIALVYKEIGDYKTSENFLKAAYGGSFKNAVRYEFADIQRLKDIKELESLNK